MENFLNPSPKGLNNVSPFSDELFKVDLSENIFEKKPEVEAEIELQQNPIKHINDFDTEILGKYGISKPPSFKKRILEFLKTRPNFEALESFIYKIFPSVYRTKVVKESLKKLVALNNIANEIITKKIPYGENQEYYNDLIASLYTATNIQADLKRTIHQNHPSKGK